ncbi:MAG: hypothetical protein LM517_04550 [Nitrosomonas sp.]|nr:hypothetical protein [Nitrosomonas sp.]
MHSLANSALLSKEHNDLDIPSGFYNPFLYFFVDNVLSSNQSNSLILIEFLIKTRIKKLTQDTIEQFLYDRWKRLHKREATKTAIYIISTKLCTSQNEESAKKTVRRNLDEIVKRRVQIIANHLIESRIFANWPVIHKKLI